MVGSRGRGRTQLAAIFAAMNKRGMFGQSGPSPQQHGMARDAKSLARKALKYHVKTQARQYKNGAQAPTNGPTQPARKPSKAEGELQATMTNANQALESLHQAISKFGQTHPPKPLSPMQKMLSTVKSAEPGFRARAAKNLRYVEQE